MARSWIHTVVDHAIHQVFLMSDSLSLPPQAFLEDIVLRNVQRFVIFGIHEMFRAILYQFNPSASKIVMNSKSFIRFDRYKVLVGQHSLLYGVQPGHSKQPLLHLNQTILKLLLIWPQTDQGSWVHHETILHLFQATCLVLLGRLCRGLGLKLEKVIVVLSIIGVIFRILLVNHTYQHRYRWPIDSS